MAWKDFSWIGGVLALVVVIFGTAKEQSTGEPQGYGVQGIMRFLNGSPELPPPPPPRLPSMQDLFESTDPPRLIPETIFIEEQPAFLEAGRADIPGVARLAIKYWNEQGYALREVPPDEADLRIGFSREWTLANYQAYPSNRIQMVLGDTACNGKWTLYDAKTLFSAVVLDLGRALRNATAMQPHDPLVTSYADPCELAAGNRTFQYAAHTELTSPIHGPRRGSIVAEVTTTEGRVESCLTHQNETHEREPACTSDVKIAKLYHYEAEPGRYLLDLNCRAESCRASYTITWHPSAD